MEVEFTHSSIQEYYGKILKSSNDLQTNACCPIDSVPSHLAAIIKDLHPEVRDRFYGCGTPIPDELEGRTVLDLGCGTGRDVFLLSKLVGPKGRVIGVDMTAEQLAVAEGTKAYHADKFGYANVELKKGYMEDLAALGLASESVDVVVSNCVLNLSPRKDKVFSEIFRVLKPGGELYFSDIFASRRLTAEQNADPVLLGECLGGALYTEDFRRLMEKTGFRDVRAVQSGVVSLQNEEIRRKAGMVTFTSKTIRAFKLPLEDRCEDYGQVAYYLGTIANHPHEFVLDDHHTFKTGAPMLVCGNTADMVGQTRLAKHFKVVGEKKIHLGLFDCAPAPGTKATAASSASGMCC